MSNRMKIISATVVLLIILGAICFFLFGNKKSQSSEVTQKEEPQEQSQSIDSPKSIKDLMSFSSSQTCTFTADNQSNGTVYVAKGKVSGNFTSNIEGKTMASHMLIDGKEFYMWTDGQNQGFKGNLDDMTMFNNKNQSNSSESINPDEKMNYKCQSWNVDESKFEIPNLKFTDMKEMMKSIPTGAMEKSTKGSQDVDMKAMQCKSCHSLTGEAQAQCKQALSC